MTSPPSLEDLRPLELPLDFPRPPTSGYLREVCAGGVDADLHGAFAALCDELSISPYVGLACVFQMLLLRRAGQEGAAMALQLDGGTRVLNMDLGDDPAVRDLLQRSETGLRAAPSVSLFDRAEVAERVRVAYCGAGAFADEGDTSELANHAVQCDLFLRIVGAPERIDLELDFDSEILESQTVRQLLEDLSAALRSIVRDGRCKVSRLPLAEQDPSDVRLSRWAAVSSSSGDEHLLDRFAAVAARQPHAPALLSGGEHSISYGELDARANRLARHLLARGIGRGALVGIYMERTPDLVVAILGVLKSGAGYLPIDLTYPADRVEFMLSDSGAGAVITQEHLLAQLPESAPLDVCVDRARDREAIAAESRDAPDTGAGPDDLAYVIYTSGSTGKPKGVLISRRNVLRLFDSTADWFGFGERDVWTLFHSHAFDFSVWEMWGALLYGGRLVVVSYSVSRSPEDFLRLLVDEGVTVLNQTPSAFYQLMRADAERNEPAKHSLRFVIFGGEALDLARLAPWFERYGDEAPVLVNMYGITETTVHVTYRPLSRRDLDDERGSVIGIPIPDLSLSVADPDMNIVPRGYPGEIIVGGAGVSGGYLNRPDQSSERFVPDPWSDDPGARVYRTGDLGRALGGNELQYLGRIDQQVQLRGFRIELGEIDARLLEHPGIAECRVVLREDPPADPRLVAYYVAAETAAPSKGELRGFLGARLPSYMVPAAFVELAGLPLTPHGKLDVRTLPAPERERPVLETVFDHPRTELERQIAEVYQLVLDIDEIGIKDNFFELGGDSIRVTRMAGLLRERLDRDVPTVKLFENPSVASLSRYLHPQTRGSEDLDHVVERARKQRESRERRRRLRGSKQG